MLPVRGLAPLRVGPQIQAEGGSVTASPWLPRSLGGRHQHKREISRENKQGNKREICWHPWVKTQLCGSTHPQGGLGNVVLQCVLEEGELHWGTAKRSVSTATIPIRGLPR